MQQYDASSSFAFLNDRYVLNAGMFDVSRDNVAALTTVNDVESMVFDSPRTT
ncbi:hypothetical protein [Paraburkholderia unamae]|uniref:hypothetical protein n=1 Tax=Paraburkholderia unamae TaxID=219649 RepID=UPI00140240FE|nr:hypothetical protein [Paraburkholderia unamae]